MATFNSLPLEISLYILRLARHDAWRKKMDKFEQIFLKSRAKWSERNFFNIGQHGTEVHRLSSKGPVKIWRDVRIQPNRPWKIYIRYYCAHLEFIGNPKNKTERRLKRKNTSVRMLWVKKNDNWYEF